MTPTTPCNQDFAELNNINPTTQLASSATPKSKLGICDNNIGDDSDINEKVKNTVNDEADKNFRDIEAASYSQDPIQLATQGALVFAAMPTTIQQQLRQCSRVVLLANNPSISLETLSSLLKPSDMLVLFNHFIHSDYLANNPNAAKLAKLIFFRQIGDSQLHFGLPPRHNNVPAIEQMIEQAPVGFLFSNIRYQFPSLADDPSPDDDPIDDSVQLTVSDKLQQKLTDQNFSQVISENHEVIADYPHFEAIHSSAPSSGFFMYRMMRAIRAYLATSFEHNLDIVMIGFNHDTKTNHFWHGHNWDFEREELAITPSGITVIKQG